MWEYVIGGVTIFGLIAAVSAWLYDRMRLDLISWAVGYTFGIAHGISC